MLLTKHHALGNDFLVLLDPLAETAPTTESVVELCDRRRGVGADGLLWATQPAPDDSDGSGAPAVRRPDAVMELYNADGSRAEMSGNGIRCLAQALLRAGWAAGPEVVVSTDAGRRTLSRRAEVDERTDILAVDMGSAQVGGEAPEWTGGPLHRATWADIGNPHLVIGVESLTEVVPTDLVILGEKVNASVAAGANVHLVATGAERDALTMRTYERGVGPTDACGTGACAAAAVAHSWNLVGERVLVHMPGGTAEVLLGPTVQLVGSATFVARIDTEPGEWH